MKPGCNSHHNRSFYEEEYLTLQRVYFIWFVLRTKLLECFGTITILNWHKLMGHIWGSRYDLLYSILVTPQWEGSTLNINWLIYCAINWDNLVSRGLVTDSVAINIWTCWKKLKQFPIPLPWYTDAIKYIPPIFLRIVCMNYNVDLNSLASK